MNRFIPSGTPGVLAAFALILVTSGRADAVLLLSNGGFESGFSSWTRQDAPLSDGTFNLQTGTTSPVNLNPVPAPPGPTHSAMTDSQGPGSHVLFQDFAVPNIPFDSAILKFDIYIGNHATRFGTPNLTTLDFSTNLDNQQARVDVLKGTANPFSLAASDVLQNAYQTRIGDPFTSGYTTLSVSLKAILNANQGQTLRLRFAEVDNLDVFQFGVDNVSIDVAPIPEPSSLIYGGIAMMIGAGNHWRRRRASKAAEAIARP